LADAGLLYHSHERRFALFFCAIQGLAFQSAIAHYRRSHVWDRATRVFALYASAIGARQTAFDGSIDRRPPPARAAAQATSAPHRTSRPGEK